MQGSTRRGEAVRDAALSGILPCEEVTYRHKCEHGKQCSPDSGVDCENDELLENGTSAVCVRTHE